MTPATCSGIQVRVAATADEYAQAFRIAYQVYFGRGYTEYSPYGMRATPYQFRPGTVVFLADVDGQPVATMSIYEGQGSDLPSASGWPSELAELNGRNQRVFELGALMVLPSSVHAANPRLCLELFRSAWRYARRMRGANAFCAFVQAHHATFYKKMLGFQQFGPPKDYVWNGLSIDAVTPLILDLNTAEEVYRQRFERLGDSPRNLYKFFVLDNEAEVAERLRWGTCRLAELDLDALRSEFAHLLPVEERGPRNDEETNVESVWNLGDGDVETACGTLPPAVAW